MNDSILHGLIILQFHSLDFVEKLAGQEADFGIYKDQNTATLSVQVFKMENK